MGYLGYDAPSTGWVDDDEDDWLLTRAPLEPTKPDRYVEAPLDDDEPMAQPLNSPKEPRLLAVDLNRIRLGHIQHLDAAQSTDWRMQPPILVLTTSTAPHRSEVLSVGDYLTKPDRVEAVSHLYQQLLRHWVKKQID